MFLKENWEGPIVLKGMMYRPHLIGRSPITDGGRSHTGIQSVGDAKKAISIGVDGIVVSVRSSLAVRAR